MKGRHRLLLTLTVVALSAATLVAAGGVWLIRAAARGRAVERITAETALLAHWIPPLTADDAQSFSVEAARRLDVRVTLFAEDGTVLGDSARDRESLARMDDHGDRPEIVSARIRGTGASHRVSAVTNVDYFYSARRVEGNGPIRFVRIALPSAQVYREGGRYGGSMAGVSLLAMLVLLAIASFAVRRLSRPLERMAEAVERTAGGELQLALPPGEIYEVERLGASVRRMRQDLLAKLAELESERTVLDSVVSGMKEGLILVGADRRVRLANDALRRIFDLDLDPVGLPLHAVVRQPAVIRAIEATLDGEQDEVESVLRPAASGRSFEIRVTPLRAKGSKEIHGALALLLDISRLESLENVRREFVANVSHELRTPLTSIQASLETLQDGGLDDREHAWRFLDILRRNAVHMAALVEDLTDLSLIETGAVSLEIRRIDAREVARDVAERLKPVAAERGVSIELALAAPFSIPADRRHLEQIFTNLLDNALKFNRPGGRVTIDGYRVDDRPVIVVEDTGLGIPSDCLEKIFHRFYRVDSERSGQKPGTGLGLALVKHLMRLHGGSVRAESELGEGSRFILEFPKPERALGLAG